jgi:ribose-phosphate pyrophosphokinase
MAFRSPELKIFTGSAHRELAQRICAYIGVQLGDATVTSFPDGETFVKINENIRGRDVYIVQPTCPPTNQNLMELLIMVDAARRASAMRITAVLPFFGYARQDRKDQPRVAISAKLMANIISQAGADRVLAIDFHQHQLQGFFDLPVDHLYSAPVFTAHYRAKGLKNLAIVASDVGGAKMARGFAKRLDASFAIIDKRRTAANVAEAVNVVGDVEGKDCIIPDDMIDTGGTMAEAAHALKKLGAGDIYLCATHALLSGPAVERLTQAPILEVAVTNTIHLPPEKRFDKLKVLSIAGLLAKAIGYTHSDQSVSALFE